MKFTDKVRKIYANRYLNTFTKIAITLLFFITVNSKVEFDKLITLFSTISIYLVIFSLLFGFLNILFHVERWHILLKSSEISDSRRVAWLTILWGTLLAFVTPGRVGELFRGNGIINADSRKVLFSVLVDKFFTVVTLLFFGIVSFAIKETFFKSYILSTEFFSIIIVIILVTLLPLLFMIIKKTHFFKKIYRFFGNYKLLSKKNKISIIVFSILEYFSLVIETVFLFRAMGIENLKDTLLSVSTAYAIMPFISVSIAGMGVREGCFALFLKHTDVLQSVSQITTASLGVSLIILIINLFLPSLVGGIWVWIKKKEV